MPIVPTVVHGVLYLRYTQAQTGNPMGNHGHRGHSNDPLRFSGPVKK